VLTINFCLVLSLNFHWSTKHNEAFVISFWWGKTLDQKKIFHVSFILLFTVLILQAVVHQMKMLN